MTATIVHPLTRCEACGQSDDHPKFHYGTRTTHHDCADADHKADAIGGAHSQHALITAKIFKACEDGLRGHELREHAATLQMNDSGDAVMLKAQTFANDILDATLNGGASGSFVLGGTTYTLPLKCRFQSTLSVAATAGTEFPATGGYSAGGVSLSGLFTSAASAQSKANTGAITVTNSPAGTWAGNEITDSSGTPKRMIFGPGTTLGKTVNSGDTCTIPSGSLVGNET